MRRTAAAALALALAAGIAGCGGRSAGGGEFAPVENSVYISGDGTVSSAFVENYEKDYYTSDSLKAYLEEAIAGQYGDLDVTLEECSVQDGVMKAVFRYGSPEDLVSFLADQKSGDLDIEEFQVETVEEGISDGTLSGGMLVSVSDGKQADFQTLSRESDGYLVTVKGTAAIQAEGETLYVSEGVEMTDQTARVAGGPAYLIIKK